jgi:hypothetical protein
MTAIQISCVGFAVRSFIVVYEMLGVSGYSKYGTFNLKGKISWNAGNVQDLRIMHIKILYLSFPKMCFAGLGTLAELTHVCNLFVIKNKTFLHG